MKQFLDTELNDLKPSTLWQQLCNLVRRLDPTAANWMESNPPDDPDGNANRSLGTAFLWANTPQGHTFWWELHLSLEERYPRKYPIRVEVK